MKNKTVDIYINIYFWILTLFQTPWHHEPEVKNKSILPK